MSEVRDISAREAWTLLESDPEAQLVDCRTQAEWNFVGLPDISALGRKPVLVEWSHFPNTGPNPSFIDQLAAEVGRKDRTLVFICRSGARSMSAARAAIAAGFPSCINLAGGFEGDRDAEKHRGRINGWKSAGLPWHQG